MKASLRIKNNNYYAVLSFKEEDNYKQKWVALGIPARNNKRRAEVMLEAIKRDFEESMKSPKDLSKILFVDYLKEWLYKKKPFVEITIRSDFL